jgi:serine/threonine protein kinase
MREPDCHAMSDLKTMPMPPRVAHYRLLAPLGAGGMGVVYRAEDTKLLREVALKFLPTGTDADRDAVGRLTREARTGSALNHPNICTVYEIGEHEGRPYIAMELVEGTALSALIAHQPLPIGRIVVLGIEMADAFEAAHARGILHRDIKPSNVIVTPRGRAKILDFGLAKDMRGQGSRDLGPDAMTQFTTSPGMIAGTIGYMSPEQARGMELDARSDIFSFGTVLYEMATGQPSFGGSTIGVIFDALLNEAPTPASTLNPALPAGLDAILSKALEKDRELRYQTAADLRADLQRLARTLEPKTSSIRRAAIASPVPVPNAARASGSSGARVAIVAASVAAVALSIYGAYRFQAAPVVLQVAAPQSPASSLPKQSFVPTPVPPPLETAPSENTKTIAAASSPVATPAAAVRTASPAPPPPMAAQAPPTPVPSSPSTSDELTAIRARLRSGDVEAALSDLQRIVARQPGPASLEAYALLLEAHGKRSNPQAVLGTIKALTTAYPSDPRAAQLLLQVAQTQVSREGAGQLGRLRFTRQIAAMILMQYPDSPAASAARSLQVDIDAKLAALPQRGAGAGEPTPPRRGERFLEARGNRPRPR